MTDSLSGCFTCMRRTDNFLRICDDSNTECVDQILARHFWFERSDFEVSVLCTSCWEKIDAFHKFYCEVADLHHSDVLRQVQVKVETNGRSENDPQSQTPKVRRGRKRKQSLEDGEVENKEGDQFPVPVLVKLEVGDQEQSAVETVIDEISQPKVEFDNEATDSDPSNEDSSFSNEVDSTEEESDEESSKPIAARRRPIARNTPRRRRIQKKPARTSADKDALIRKHLDKLPCGQCDEVYITFTSLEKHCRKIHDTLATVICCNRQYQKQVNLYEHLLRHKNIYKFHCKECDRCFKNADGLIMHNMLHHTPEENKRFRCSQCCKAFAAEILLTSHLNWHATVEPRNIVCEKCNKYFTNTKRLENHVATHHPEQMIPETFPPTSAEPAYHLQQQLKPSEPTDTTDGSELLKLEPGVVDSEPNENSIRKSGELAKPFRRKTPEELAKEDELIRKYCALNCEHCDFSADTFSKLELHYKNAHDERGYASCCLRKFGKKSRLYEHVCVHENPEHFKCEICAKTFLNSFGLANHMMWKHTPDSEKPFSCDVCGNRFWKDYLLKQHMEYHLALEEKKFACKECDRHFGTNLLLKSHEQTVHGLSASWVCDICAKGFPLKSALEFHRQQHTQEGRAAMKAQCEHCKLWLKNVRSLRSHRKRCNSNPVSCELCGRECSNIYALQGHKKFVHSGTPAYSCSFCAKPFKRLLRLKEHEAGHTGELLYKCEYCPRTCNSSSNMYTHKKVAHPEQWAEKMAHRFHQR
ncbi:transcription factor grauzone-like [Topomyia yanbarensis]|uniref:transcription factor grauzone-like n=1 Tax=Topomyia yanbarensis TaxID=2498891 RepID=UPI00273C48EF|nr:transcription factor grauzone-like [Topomyia yanbarensis]